MTPRIVIRQTKTAGWRVVYVAQSGHEYVLGRRLPEGAAREMASTARSVYDAEMEVEA